MFPESVGVIHHIWEERPSIGGHIVLALRNLGIRAESFSRNQETDGWDCYLYVDQWSLAPKHPSIFWAIDMIVPQEAWRGNLEAYTKHAGAAGTVFAAHTDTVDYLASRGVGAQWLPLAANPDYHRPWPDEKIVYDVIALHHNCQNRPAYTGAIRKSGLRQFVGWRDGEDYSQWMCRSQSGLSLSRSNELTLRVFEVMAMGVSLITDRCRDLDILFQENTHYLGYGSPEEMLEKVIWVQDHSEEARAMATRARKEVLAKHTFHHRVLTLLGGNKRWLTRFYSKQERP